MANRGSKKNGSVKRGSKKLKTKRKPTKKVTFGKAVIVLGNINLIWSLTDHLSSLPHVVQHVMDLLQSLMLFDYEERLAASVDSAGRVDQAKATRVLADAAATTHVFRQVAKTLNEHGAYLEEHEALLSELAEQLARLFMGGYIEHADAMTEATFRSWSMNIEIPRAETSTRKRIRP